MYFYVEEGGTPTLYMGAHWRHLANTISHLHYLLRRRCGLMSNYFDHLLPLTNNCHTLSTVSSVYLTQYQNQPGIQRVQALTDISCSEICCHSNETCALIANLPNTEQLEGTPTIPPTYILARAILSWIWFGNFPISALCIPVDGYHFITKNLAVWSYML